MTEKSRDDGKRFVHIEYYHEGANHVGGTVGTLRLKDDDYRLDRVKKLRAPVGPDEKPITTYRFDYQAVVKKHNDQKRVEQGHTDVFDAHNHKTRYTYDDQHRLTHIMRYSGSDPSSYVPYTEESFLWDAEGSLLAKIFKDGNGNVHHARVFTYDAYGNVATNTLCGKLTGQKTPPLLVDARGRLIENGYERETKSYTYSQDGLNLLLLETDAAGKTTRYVYKPQTDKLQAKYVAYEGKIRLREFYTYDSNHVLEKKIVDDGCQEAEEDLSYATERHLTWITPRQEAPLGLPQIVEEKVRDFHTQEILPLKKSHYTHSHVGKLLEEKVFDAEGKEAYTLKWEYDLHGNLISETNAMGLTLHKKYDLATGNLIEQRTPDVVIKNTYDFANRLIEKKEVHADREFTIQQQFDYLGNCHTLMNPYGQITHQIFDDFGRVLEVHHPQVLTEGVFASPIEKTSYDIAGFPILQIDANGGVTHLEVNIRGQPTKIQYPMAPKRRCSTLCRATSCKRLPKMAPSPNTKETHWEESCARQFLREERSNKPPIATTLFISYNPLTRRERSPLICMIQLAD